MQIYGILLNIRGILLKNREKQRKSENFREFQRKSFLFFPFHYTFFPQYPDFMLYNIFLKLF